MEKDHTPFFNIESHRDALASFVRKAKQLEFKDEVLTTKLRLCIQIVLHIQKKPTEWSEACKYSISSIGRGLIIQFEQIKVEQKDGDRITHIYLMLYRFLCEFILFTDPDDDEEFELLGIREQILDDAKKKQDDVSFEIQHITYLLPAKMIQNYLQQGGVKSVIEFDERVSRVEELKIEWARDYEERKTEIDNLKESIDELKFDFNFVGLTKGFRELGNKKNVERKALLGNLKMMGACILLMPVVYYSVYWLATGESFTFAWDSALHLIPLLSFEVLMLYFFRIVLHNYNSVNTQLVQIELRQTLCRFIQKYAEYSTTIKKNDPVALEKFESLIFSGILSNSDKLPTTFDGMEQLSALLKNIRTK
ncbi:hypothetical protein JHL08_09395 [Vibrio campbellii]|uniref:hypothetical protein n=1 Tax=Vibrio campbellii TaxID=680 RepID=UPI003988C974